MRTVALVYWRCRACGYANRWRWSTEDLSIEGPIEMVCDRCTRETTMYCDGENIMEARVDKRKDVVLGLDMATKTGWAFSDASGNILESGVQEFRLDRGESPGMRFLRFRKWIFDLVAIEAPAIVAYEAAHFRGGHATELCVGFQTRAQEAAAQWGAETAPVHTGALKRYATGRGNASKMEMIVKAATILGRPPADDNEADAVLVALWAAEKYLAKEAH